MSVKFNYKALEDILWSDLVDRLLPILILPEILWKRVNLTQKGVVLPVAGVPSL